MKKLLVFSIIINLAILPSGAVLSQTERVNDTFLISVEDVRLIAISNNLEIKLAQLDSKIKGTDLGYKEAVFDTILNGEIGYTNDQRKSASSFAGTKSITNEYNIGIDKKLRSGTDVEIDLTNSREWTDSAYVSTNPYHESQIEIGLTQPIAKNFFGLIDRGNIEIVKLEIRNAELDSYIKIENAIIDAEKAYWKFALATEEFKIKKEMLKKAIRLFNQYRRKLKIGLVETGDVLASEANMHVRGSELLLASNELKSAEELLRVHLNMKNDLKLFPIDDLKGKEINADFTESLNTAFENRRDYLSKKNDIEAKKVKLRMKKNSLFPEIDLNATFATNGIDSRYSRALEDVYEDSNPKYYVGIEFKYPLENNEAESEHKKATLEKTKAIINLQKTERQVISDVDEKFRNLSVNKINMSRMQRVENLQQGKLSQEEKRFKYGRSSSDTLIRYQEDALNASLLTQRSYFDHRVAILELMDAEDSFLKRIGFE
ncbi:MAG: TolC family protein [Candidatus Omnitrophica bacterium]|nr:TolC family protein [Candidatus Omnitrophota bacterium]